VGCLIGVVLAYGIAAWLLIRMDKQNVDYEKNLPVIRRSFDSK